MATTQRERHAAQAREKMEARREDAEGAAGWVAERAGAWDLEAGHDVALWPGGEIDSLRPWTDRDGAVLGGRKGFIRMAIRAGVPISTVGGPDSMPVLARGRRVAKLLQLDKVALARRRAFPVFG